MLEKSYVMNSQTREIDATVAETLDCREGVVMDSYIAVDKDGEMFVVIATYETAWTSGYTLYTGDEKDLWEVWEDFTQAYDSQFEEEEE